MIDYGSFTLVLKHLETQFRNHQQLESGLPSWMQEAVAESVIQRFETCYDTLWKALKRHLHEELGLPQVPASPKPVFRMANENHLLPSGVAQWLRYADARIGTSHDDSGHKARQCLELMDAFIADAIALHQELSGTAWT